MAAAAGSENGKKSVVPAAPKKVRSLPSHPPFLEMISDAIGTMKERTGSSQIAIAKFIEQNNKQLPANFRKLLLVQLKRLVASGKLVKVKASFKMPSPATKKAAKAVCKPKSGKAQPEATAKSAVAPLKKRKAVTTEKAVKVAKNTAKSTPGKKVTTEKAVKVAKNTAKSTPGKKKPVNAKKVSAAVAVKKVNKPITSLKKPKSLKSPVKKVAPKKPKSVKL